MLTYYLKLNAKRNASIYTDPYPCDRINVCTCAFDNICTAFSLAAFRSLTALHLEYSRGPKVWVSLYIYSITHNELVVLPADVIFPLIEPY